MKNLISWISGGIVIAIFLGLIINELYRITDDKKKTSKEKVILILVVMVCILFTFFWK